MRLSSSTSGMWKRGMAWIMRHRQTKGPETDRPNLNHRATASAASSMCWPDVQTRMSMNARPTQTHLPMFPAGGFWGEGKRRPGCRHEHIRVAAEAPKSCNAGDISIRPLQFPVVISDGSAPPRMHRCRLVELGHRGRAFLGKGFRRRSRQMRIAISVNGQPTRLTTMFVRSAMSGGAPHWTVGRAKGFKVRVASGSPLRTNMANR
jgi:hypothetical protein